MFGDLNVCFAQIHKWSVLPCEHTKTNGKNLIEYKPNKDHDFTPMGRTSLSTSQIRTMILLGLELCQSCCTTVRRPSSSTHCSVKHFNKVFLLLGLSICHVTKERRISKTMPLIPFLVTWVYWRFSTNLFA
jgi:hypothetical protein